MLRPPLVIIRLDRMIQGCSSEHEKRGCSFHFTLKI